MDSKRAASQRRQPAATKGGGSPSNSRYPIIPFSYSLKAIQNSIILSLLGIITIYVGFLLLLILPASQRIALYAHPFNTGFLWNVNTPEWWGFAQNQVTPFRIPSTEGTQLYAWHVLPIATYTAKADELRLNDRWDPERPFHESPSYKLLQEDPDSKLVIYFHGNGGHLVDSRRPDFVRLASALSAHIHVLVIDYRGFGLSNGTPTEQGVIEDGIATVSYALGQLGIPEERIMIVGHSLGTAIASAVALHFSTAKTVGSGVPSLLPFNRTSIHTEISQLNPAMGAELIKPHTFGKVILIAPFARLDTLILTYHIGGIIPILAPLNVFPPLAKFAMRLLHEKWDTSARLQAMISAVAVSDTSFPTILNLHIIHALDDRDIPYGHSLALFDDIYKAGHIIIDGSDQNQPSPKGDIEERRDDDRSSTTSFTDFSHSQPETRRFWKTDQIQASLHLVPFGGHNNIMYSTALSGAILDGFGLIEPVRHAIDSDGPLMKRLWANSKIRINQVVPLDSNPFSVGGFIARFTRPE